MFFQNFSRRSRAFLAAASIVLTSVASAPSVAQDRFPPIAKTRMSAEQTAITDAILSGPRKSMAGPFDTWLRSPDLAGRLVKVGDYLRFESALPRQASEFAILITSRVWNTPFAWAYHYPLAIKSGVTPSVLEQIARGDKPTGMSADERLVYAFSTELHRDKRVGDQTFDAARARFGERGIVDLVALNGYYDIVCMTLNVAKTSTPSDYSGIALTTDKP